MSFNLLMGVFVGYALISYFGPGPHPPLPQQTSIETAAFFLSSSFTYLFVWLMLAAGVLK